MVIFELDGVLADISHREHYIVDPIDNCFGCYEILKYNSKDIQIQCPKCKRFPLIWKKDQDAYNLACFEDQEIYPATTLFQNINPYKQELAIWTTRCESSKDRTEEWIIDRLFLGNFISLDQIELKMRPYGNDSPPHILKKQWLAESLLLRRNNPNEKVDVDYVFESNIPCVHMWQSNKIFVFNCNQNQQE